MKFNYGLKKEQFLNDWKQLRSEYSQAGIADAEIIELYDYDYTQFKKERIFCIHNQSYEQSCSFGEDDACDDCSPLMKRYCEQFCVHQPDISDWGGRYDWIEDIDTPELVKQIKSLSAGDLELLTRMVVDGMSRADLARQLAVSRSAITQKIKRIKNILEEVYF